jgi:hypothetical protein
VRGRTPKNILPVVRRKTPFSVRALPGVGWSMSGGTPGECVRRRLIPLRSSEGREIVDVPNDCQDEERSTCKEPGEVAWSGLMVAPKRATIFTNAG